MDEYDFFTTSDGVKHLMTYANCVCTVWQVSFRGVEKFVGRCGRCGEGVKAYGIATTKEAVINRFRHDYGREPLKGYID